MCISSIKILIMFIFVVNVFHICYAPVDNIGLQMCKNEIKNVFRTREGYNNRKYYAQFAFKFLREDDTCFVNASNNTTFNYAKRYYQAIKAALSIVPGAIMMTPYEYCDSNPFPTSIFVYFDRRINDFLTSSSETCKIQMSLNGFPENNSNQQILDWIYENIAINKLNIPTDTYVIQYVKTCQKVLDAPGLLFPGEFCTTLNTFDGPPEALDIHMYTAANE